MLAAVYGYMDVLYSVWIKARAGLTCTLWCEVQRRKGRGVPGEGRLGYGTVGSDFDLVEERRDTRREQKRQVRSVQWERRPGGSATGARGQLGALPRWFWSSVLLRRGFCAVANNCHSVPLLSLPQPYLDLPPPALFNQRAPPTVARADREG